MLAYAVLTYALPSSSPELLQHTFDYVLFMREGLFDLISLIASFEVASGV
jgi:hypothetical protein